MIKEKNSNNILIRKIIKLLIVILIVLCIVLVIISSELTKERVNSFQKLEYINDETKWNDEEYPYTAYMLFIKYNGEISAENMVKSMSYVSREVLPRYYSKLKKASDSKINKYFKENSSDIYMDIGINKEEEFLKVIKTLQTQNTDTLNFSSYRVDKDNIKLNNNYAETNLYITYENNSEIGFKVRIYNTIQQNSSSLRYTSL